MRVATHPGALALAFRLASDENDSAARRHARSALCEVSLFILIFVWAISMTWFLCITGCHRPGRRRRRGQGRPGRGGAAASPGGRRRRRPGERGGRAGAEDGDEGAAANGKVAPAGPPLLRQALGYHHERSIDLKPKSYRGAERPDISLTLACAALPAYRPHLPPPGRPPPDLVPPDFLREPSCSSPLAPTTAAVSYTHLTLPTNREV